MSREVIINLTPCILSPSRRGGRKFVRRAQPLFDTSPK
jgi:hypothetical protein